MIIIINNEDLELLYQGKKPKGKPQYNNEVVRKFRRTIDRLKFSDNIVDIRAQRSLNFEALKGDLKGKYSVRVDIKYRLIFRIEKNQAIVEQVIVVEDLSKHYE